MAAIVIILIVVSAVCCVKRRKDSEICEQLAEHCANEPLLTARGKKNISEDRAWGRQQRQKIIQTPLKSKNDTQPLVYGVDVSFI